MIPRSSWERQKLSPSAGRRESAWRGPLAKSATAARPKEARPWTLPKLVGMARSRAQRPRSLECRRKYFPYSMITPQLSGVSHRAGPDGSTRHYPPEGFPPCRVRHKEQSIVLQKPADSSCRRVPGLNNLAGGRRSHHDRHPPRRGGARSPCAAAELH